MENITRDYVLSRLPNRAVDANKGSFGTVAAFAGSSLYRGAAALAAEGALRCGAGLVFLATVPEAMQLALLRTPECCVLPCRADADGWLCPDDVRAGAARFAPGKAVLLAGPGRRGIANSTYYVGIDLGAALGANIGGILYGSVDINLFYVVLLLCPVLCFVTYLVFRKELRAV